MLLGVLGPFASAQSPQPARSAVRFGFSERSFGHANRADVIAAAKAWLETIAKGRGLAIDPTPLVFDSVNGMAAAVRRELVDVVSLPTDEFLALEKSISLKWLFVSLVNGKISEQYVLLVKADRPIKELKDLRGMDLMVLDHPRTCIAPLLVGYHAPAREASPGSRFFGRMTRVPKPSLAILPVFFNQAGAALVTRSSFETAGELNPTAVQGGPGAGHLPGAPSGGRGPSGRPHPGAMDLYRQEGLAAPGIAGRKTDPQSVSDRRHCGNQVSDLAGPAPAGRIRAA